MRNTIIELKVVLRGVGFPHFSGASAYINTGAHKIIVDTGSARHRETLLHKLGRLGLRAEEIDTVILTHMHRDHFENMDLFRNAGIFVMRAELASYEDIVKIKETFPQEEAIKKIFETHPPGPMADSSLMIEEKIRLYHSIRPIPGACYKRIVFMDDLESLYRDIGLVRFAGHSEAPRGVRVSYRGERYLICGDAITSKRQLERSVTGRADREDSYETIARNLEIARTQADVIIPGHGLPFYAADGRAAKEILL